jgi:Tol biopolymer transport system component
MAFVRERVRSKLWLVTGDGTGIPELTRLAVQASSKLVGSPSISPDGRDYVFRAGKQRESNLFVQSLAGGPIRQITSTASIKVSPSWSPDGRQIAYGSDEGGRWRVWVVDAQGGAPRVIAGSELSSDTGQVTWAPGARILYDRAGGAGLHLLDATNGREARLPGRAGARALHPFYSPDGRRVALMTDGAPGGAPDRLVVVELADGSERPLLEGHRPFGWTADGRSIYTAAAENPLWVDARHLLLLDDDGGSPRPFLTLPIDEGVLDVRVAADGESVVCSVGETDADVWLVDDFD